MWMYNVIVNSGLCTHMLVVETLSGLVQRTIYLCCKQTTETHMLAVSHPRRGKSLNIVGTLQE